MPSGFRALLGSILVMAAVAKAPYQCASEVDPNRRLYEDPSEVLYDLAERFKASGEHRARIDTLRFLVERYPSSRFARMARLDLEELGESGSSGEAGATRGSGSSDASGTSGESGSSGAAGATRGSSTSGESGSSGAAGASRGSGASSKADSREP